MRIALWLVYNVATYLKGRMISSQVFSENASDIYCSYVVTEKRRAHLYSARSHKGHMALEYNATIAESKYRTLEQELTIQYA